MPPYLSFCFFCSCFFFSSLACLSAARWLSLYDDHVLPEEESVDDWQEPLKEGEAATGRYARFDSASRHILIVGGMQNLEDYQGDVPIPVTTPSRATAIRPHFCVETFAPERAASSQGGCLLKSIPSQ